MSDASDVTIDVEASSTSVSAELVQQNRVLAWLSSEVPESRIAGDAESLPLGPIEAGELADALRSQLSALQVAALLSSSVLTPSVLADLLHRDPDATFASPVLEPFMRVQASVPRILVKALESVPSDPIRAPALASAMVAVFGKDKKPAAVQWLLLWLAAHPETVEATLIRLCDRPIQFRRFISGCMSVLGALKGSRRTAVAGVVNEMVQVLSMWMEDSAHPDRQALAVDGLRRLLASCLFLEPSDAGIIQRIADRLAPFEVRATLESMWSPGQGGSVRVAMLTTAGATALVGGHLSHLAGVAAGDTRNVSFEEVIEAIVIRRVSALLVPLLRSPGTDELTRSALEMELFNIGVHRGSAPGTVEPFDVAAHEVIEGVASSGDVVRVLTGGWFIARERGTEWVVRAEVAATTSSAAEA